MANIYQAQIFVKMDTFELYAQFSDADGIVLQGWIDIYKWLLNETIFKIYIAEIQDGAEALLIPNSLHLLLNGLNANFIRNTHEFEDLAKKHIFVYEMMMDYKSYKAARKWFDFKEHPPKQRSKISTYIASYSTWRWPEPDFPYDSVWESKDDSRVDEEYLNMTDEEFAKYVRRADEAKRLWDLSEKEEEKMIDRLIDGMGYLD